MSREDDLRRLAYMQALEDQITAALKNHDAKTVATVLAKAKHDGYSDVARMAEADLRSWATRRLRGK